MFFRVQNFDRDPAVQHRRLDIFLPPQLLHPAFQRAPVESGFLFDLPVVNRRAAQNSSDASGLMRLAQYQPSV
jgi:hypothetical protein